MQIFDNKQVSKLNNIIYKELRNVTDFSEKMTISTIVLVCMNDCEMFADLLYANESINDYVIKINKYFNDKGAKQECVSEVKLDKNKEESFKNLIDKLIEVYEFNNFFKCLYERDSYAIAVKEIFESGLVQKMHIP